MPYCSSEGKLHGFDDPTVEVNSEDVDGRTVSLEVMIDRPCASCGQEQISYYEASLEADIDHECEKDKLRELDEFKDMTDEELDELLESDEEPEFTISVGEGEVSEGDSDPRSQRQADHQLPLHEAALLGHRPGRGDVRTVQREL